MPAPPHMRLRQDEQMWSGFLSLNVQQLAGRPQTLILNGCGISWSNLTPMSLAASHAFTLLPISGPRSTGAIPWRSIPKTTAARCAPVANFAAVRESTSVWLRGTCLGSAFVRVGHGPPGSGSRARGWVSVSTPLRYTSRPAAALGLGQASSAPRRCTRPGIISLAAASKASRNQPHMPACACTCSRCTCSE